MIASLKCYGQTIPTDTAVLKHLYKESLASTHFKKDVMLADSIIKQQKAVIDTKDSMIENRSEALNVCEFEKIILNSKLDVEKSNNKKLNREIKIKKFLLYVSSALNVIAGAYFVLNTIKR